LRLIALFAAIPTLHCAIRRKEELAAKNAKSR
jgi:hypothetical protein